jgi:hypothetical protein
MPIIGSIFGKNYLIMSNTWLLIVISTILCQFRLTLAKLVLIYDMPLFGYGDYLEINMFFQLINRFGINTLEILKTVFGLKIKI